MLTFFLNFIPNVGGLGAVLLPMPLIALDPQFSSAETAVSFLVPFGVNIFAKDVLEPKILGHATDLNPVTILLAILIYGSVWGVTGMVGRGPPLSPLGGQRRPERRLPRRLPRRSPSVRWPLIAL